MAAFADQLHNRPMALAGLDLVNFQTDEFCRDYRCGCDLDLFSLLDNPLQRRPDVTLHCRLANNPRAWACLHMLLRSDSPYSSAIAAGLPHAIKSVSISCDGIPSRFACARLNLVF
jgi:hypothetical protein